MTALLSVRGTTKLFRRGSELVHAVESVDLTFHRREIVALVGPSGSGKTTLLYLLAGWEQPDEGEVVWEEATRPASVDWKSLALVPQSLGLVEELSVRENVALPLRLGGGEDEAGVDRLLEDLGLTDLAARYPLETSLGEQQRTAVARALVSRPDAILADEPTGHQDEGWAEAVFLLFGRASAEGACCIVATHNPDVAGFADRSVTMHDGRVVSETVSAAPEGRGESMWAPRRAETSIPRNQAGA